MTKTVLGTIHGKTIELTQETGLRDGEQVVVTVQPTAAQMTEPWGEGLRRCAGALADVPGLAEDMNEILRERNVSNFRDVQTC